MTHQWTSDVSEDGTMTICSNCDTYRGSRASLDLCPAGPVHPDGQFCEGCGLTRDPFTGAFCDWCTYWMIEAERNAV